MNPRSKWIHWCGMASEQEDSDAIPKAPQQTSACLFSRNPYQVWERAACARSGRRAAWPAAASSASSVQKRKGGGPFGSPAACFRATNPAEEQRRQRQGSQRKPWPKESRAHTFVPFQKCLGVALLSIDLASSASLDFSLDRRHGPSHHYIKRTTTKERLSFAMSSMGLLPSRSHDSH